jgi:hypothetical protein
MQIAHASASGPDVLHLSKSVEPDQLPAAIAAARTHVIPQPDREAS